ncbi:MAG: hypothetical protein J6S71_02190 [Clostridia bacterium]|nr:hypothetical protein [Clostridia bacterium]
MKTSSLYLRLLTLILAILMCFSAAACTGDSAESTDPESTEPEITEAPPAEIETVDLIADGKLLYTIVRPDGASPTNVRAAITINNFCKNLGIESKITDWGDKSPDVPEILVGETKFFPKEAIEGIDLSRIGANGFVIKNFGNKIIIAGANDKALLDAVDYFIKNYLDIVGGKTQMPKDLFYISSNGLFLSELTLNGCALTDYIFTADERAEEAQKALMEFFNSKSATKTAGNGNKYIRLIIDPAVGDVISAKFENGDLNIRAKDAEAMKKAVVCFWYENIAYATGAFDLPGDLNYTRDLTKTVFYSDFDVKQSENECCMDAMIAAHNYANEKGYKVFADYGAKYYLASTGKTVTIKTDVEWGNAEIIIDDSGVTPDKRGNWIFSIPGSYSTYSIDNMPLLKRGMTNIGITLQQKSIVTVYDANTTHYIRYGGNADNGATMVDSVVVDKNGDVDPDAPIMWNFDNITAVSIRPIDEKTLTVSGGIITTIANKAPSEYTYYARGISVTRSNTVIDGVTHYITGEGATGAPYNGFVSINNCAYVTVRNCVFTGHKTYQSPTTAMGSYDIGMGNSISVSFINCTQANDINDSKYWGVSGTNYCKNFVYDGCVLSRFDAHKGVANGAIKNSVIGHAGASIIGYGTFLIENSVFFTNKIIDLRSDYGSTWEGEIVIRNCTVAPIKQSDIHIFKGSNTGEHNFGYPCYATTSVVIDGLTIENAVSAYIFANLNSKCTSDTYVPKYPFYAPAKVTVKNITISLKEGLQVSPNEFFFAKTEFVYE